MARENAALHAVALRNARKRMRLAFTSTNTGMTRFMEDGDGDGEGIAVDVRCLDEFELYEVDFIRLGAEGYEYFIRIS